MGPNARTLGLAFLTLMGCSRGKGGTDLGASGTASAASLPGEADAPLSDRPDADADARPEPPAAARVWRWDGGRLRNLSDHDVTEMAHARIRCADVASPAANLLVGLHNGVPVRNEVRCGDACPGQEFRVVRYDVDVKDCGAAGGVVALRGVPRGTGVANAPTCVPSVLAGDTPFGRPADGAPPERCDPR